MVAYTREKGDRGTAHKYRQTHNILPIAWNYLSHWDGYRNTKRRFLKIFLVQEVGKVKFLLIPGGEIRDFEVCGFT